MGVARAAKRRVLAALGLVLMLSAGCRWLKQENPADVVVTVGDAAITRAMVDLRAKTLENNPAAADPELTALTQLVQGELAAVVVNRHGEVVNASALEHHWARFQGQLPDAVKDAAATVADRQLMLRALAQPEFASLMADGYFQESDEPQQAVAERAAAIHNRLLVAPGTFDTAAREAGLEVDRLWIGPHTLRSALARTEGRIAAPATDPAGDAGGDFYGPEARAQAAELYRMLSAVKAGAVNPRLFSTPDGFQIYKIEARREGEIQVAVLTVPKLTFDEWFWPAAGDIPVKFNDRDAGREFSSRVPWARFVRIVE